MDYLTKQVNAISADAQEKVLRVLESVAWTPENIAEFRDIVLMALAEVMPAYTDMAAQAGADFYDAVRETQVGEALGASAASGYVQDATEGAVRAFVQQIVDGKPVEQFNRSVLGRVDRDVKMAENVSVAENAARDPLKPRYARVPTGAETCSFCLMLASRGFAYRSREAASHAHPGCDCRVVPGFRGNTVVEGYDPGALYSDYLDGKFGTFKCKKKQRTSSGETAKEPHREFDSVGDMARYLEEAPDLESLYARGDEVQVCLGEWFKDKKRRDKYLADIRRAASRRHGELTKGDGKGIVTYTKPRSELEPHEAVGIDQLSDFGKDVETIPEIGNATANLDIRMDDEEWEMKNVTNSESSVSNQLKRARIKWYKLGSDEPMRCIVTCEGCNDEFQNVVDGVRKRFREGERIIVISQDGQMVEI